VEERLRVNEQLWTPWDGHGRDEVEVGEEGSGIVLAVD